MQRYRSLLSAIAIAIGISGELCAQRIDRSTQPIASEGSESIQQSTAQPSELWSPKGLSTRSRQLEYRPENDVVTVAQNASPASADRPDVKKVDPSLFRDPAIEPVKNLPTDYPPVRHRIYPDSSPCPKPENPDDDTAVIVLVQREPDRVASRNIKPEPTPEPLPERLFPEPRVASLHTFQAPTASPVQPAPTATQVSMAPRSQLHPPVVAPQNTEPQLPAELLPPLRSVSPQGQQAAVPLPPGNPEAAPAATDELLLVPIDTPWWEALVARPLRPDTSPLSVTLEQLIVGALNHSNQIKVFSKLPLIRATTVGEADAAFDWNSFLSNRWDDISDPVGSTLTVGGNATRFNDHNLSGAAGLRRQTHSGAQVEMSQRLGWQDNNSNFFVPAPQGTSQLTLRMSQPLMRGRGTVYNNSITVLAQIDRRQADDEFQRQLQGHLLEVMRSYWELYLERGVLLQKLQSYQRAAEIARQLELRAQLDASESQLVSAQATLAQRRSDLFRAQSAVVNAESKIRALVNDPALDTSDACELIPAEPPSIETYLVDMELQRALAVQNRPEISQAIKQIKSASVRLNMSKHELLPVLNLVTEAYVSGLQGDGDVAASLARQFDTGAGSYGVGFEYELPVGNRGAKFRNRRRMLELSQLQYQYKSTLSTVQLEVEIAVRELQTSQREMTAKFEAQQARTRQLETLMQRWQRNMNDAVTGSFALENLLDAQERVAQAEFEYLQSQLTYNLSIGNLHRATGTLLQSEEVSQYRVSDFEPARGTAR
ncbi:Outer membrane efflux protein [Rosistilla oblonga]|uniref:TolC family protein n=1 Tax=Rosistilla oblonga TaxID=2527990 RepID=UPI00118833BD|nr:TolC family protein [Rosistilla oblonga]QDV13537.1 Outer membrane efflux protein [Rosistilla oblonga]